MSVFSKSDNYVKKPKRNTFDMSFQNNLTAKFGALYPVLCKEVIPGDSFRIKPTFALKFMPMYFPVQTRMKAYLHFFYVRNRNLWKDWMDFIGKTKSDLEPPYIDFKGETPVSGSLSDHLGLPTVMYGGVDVDDPDYGSEATFYIQLSLGNVVMSGSGYDLYAVYYLYPSENPSLMSIQDYLEAAFVDGIGSLNVSSGYLSVTDLSRAVLLFSFLEVPVRDSLLYNSKISVATDVYYTLYQRNVGEIPITVLGYLCLFDSDGNYVGYVAPVLSGTNYVYDLGSANYLDGHSFAEVDRFGFASVYTFPDETSYILGSTFLENYPSTVTSYSEVDYGDDGDIFGSNSGYRDINTQNSPYYDSSQTQDENAPQIKVSALPYRAYESIYNAFFRNPQNNPFVVDGVEEYNKYIPSREGGAESIDHFPLRYRNWESDFLTSALPSPQQGTAPLVGISATGAMTFADEDGNTYSAQAEFSADGNTITGFKVTSKEMPNGNLRALVDMATSGIGINDLRNVNSLQRWLETNIRRGYKYKDQLMSHYGVKATFDELDMPEFIGGCSQDIMVNQISQTSESANTPLGTYGGQASAIGTCHSVTKYCDEHGFIIGLMSIVPVPNYSQLLPKFFLKNLTLDYFFPEFGHIGMQPIKYDEICPVQSFNASKVSGTNEMNTVFGYQRAWYDYLASVDEVHGDFRTSLRNFLINRVFKDAPELSKEFLLVDPDQVNEVFNYTEDTDKILGQIYFDIKAKRPIPMFGVPRIE